MYADMTDSEVFLTVFESFLPWTKAGMSSDWLNPQKGTLAMVNSGRKWQDLYGSLSNVSYGTMAKLSLLFGGADDNTPKWRTNLPIWALDWAQLTHSNRNDRDIALFYEDLFRHVGQIIKEDDKNQLTRLWHFTRDLPIFPKAASYGRSLSRIENKVFKFFHMPALAPLSRTTLLVAGVCAFRCI
jgi:hypothetical protein